MKATGKFLSYRTRGLSTYYTLGNKPPAYTPAKGKYVHFDTIASAKYWVSGDLQKFSENIACFSACAFSSCDRLFIQIYSNDNNKSVVILEFWRSRAQRQFNDRSTLSDRCRR